MKKLKNDLQVASRQAKALNAKLDKLIKEVAKLSKPAPAKKKAAPKKKAAAKKKAVAKKKAPVKKKVAAKKKAPAKKKAAAPTAFDTVLGIINRSKGGVSTGQIKVKTKFNDKKIANIIYKAKKQGKIKSKSKGIYVKK